MDTTTLETASRVSLDNLLDDLRTDADDGLSPDEAERRLRDEGPNELRSAPPMPLWRRILAQFQDPLIYLLLIAVAISTVAWWIEGAEGLPVDALVITLVVIANAVLGFIQESRAEQAVAALQAMTHPHATVVRGGQTTEITAGEVVRGDILLLSEGDSVAADGRLLQASALRVAEAALTGESAAVGKKPGTLDGEIPLGDRTNMVFSGTAVTQGTGRAVITATGMATQMGEVARLLDETERDDTPLEREIGFVGKMLGAIVVAIAVVVMVTVWLVSGVDTLDDAVTVLLLGVSLAVAAVPEGLPAILSVVLSIGVQKMARRDAIVKDLGSVETLGSASVICSDKTGTLTSNEMTVQEIRTLSGTASVTGVGYAPDGEVECGSEEQRFEDELVLMGGALSSNAELRETDGEWEVLGDPTEGAFLVAERKLGVHDRRDNRFTRLAEVPFTSDRKRMSTLQRDHDRDEVVLVTKGAPDVVLERCTSVLCGDDVVPLTDELRAQLSADIEEMSGQAMRTMGVALREVDAGDVPDDKGVADAERAEDLETELTYLGAVGMIDPAREEAADAVADAHRAGIRVIMITGDHPATALRIARDLGITDDDGRAVSGVELDRADDSTFAELARSVNVFARVAPEHKLRIVDALQADGQIVAMTGDGVNDAPALKSADIGVAMGITGTEVTKEAGSMVLRDDNFATIVAAVEQGRVIFDNIKKFLRYLLSSNMGEVLTVFFGVVLAGLIGLTEASGAAIVVPLLATQILWINLVTDSAPALALGVDPQTDDVMARRPRAIGERVIDLGMWGIIVFVGAVMAASTLLTMDLFLVGGLIPGSDDLTTARTAAFTTLVFAQLFNVFSARSPITSAFHGLGTNRWLLAAVAFGAVSQVAVVEIPLLQTAFGTASLDLRHWLIAIAMASGVLWAEEARKLINRARHRRRGREADKASKGW
ncbi:cation-translocating P-type ATPase [Tessaracoccus flavus]|uniref:Haloacid dehalogenase n=1 Tax=Tessaracoccus flavus TaxID=1610493 RepID=A0A1Q2CHG8_9ACTN|nr:cation-translocating P-type ATPase [Tessaracoccus flavus]AQP45554.1 haloacid dehalogenase [Tessaracoccus flavus]SDY79192.1 plasma-membrane calcium-translocating P-type ATPase [Tessaracoccus flavus]